MQKFDKSYIEVLNTLKQKIKIAQLKAGIAVNTEMILLYWEIGKTIIEKQKEKGWGAKIINNLSRDLSRNFPEIKGFSTRNLNYMRKFAELYPDHEFMHQVGAQIPWRHHILLMDKIKKEKERKWYIQKTIEHGWSRNILTMQIETDLYERQVEAPKITNFQKTLPKIQSDLAQEILKDPYNFDFITISDDYREKEIENELVKHITHFLLELGAGFAFVGQQYKITVSDKDFYIDLLFYHIKLKCYIVIELKAGEFKPEYAGKLNFYLSAVDDVLKEKDNNSSIGIILCKTKDKIIAEYALRELNRPVGISEFKLVKSIPEDLKTSLPTIEELEAELAKNE